MRSLFIIYLFAATSLFFIDSVYCQSGDVLWDMEFINTIAGGQVKNCLSGDKVYNDDGELEFFIKTDDADGKYG